MKKIIIMFFILISFSCIAFASANVVWWQFAPTGNTLIPMGEEAIFGNSTDNQNNQWRCVTFSGLGGHTIQGIYGNIQAMRLYTNPTSDLTFHQMPLFFYVTSHNVQSGTGNYLNTPCVDELGHKITDSSFGDGKWVQLGAWNLSLVGKYSETDQVNYDNLNYVIPQGQNFVIMYNYGTGSPPPSQSYLSNQLTMVIK